MMHSYKDRYTKVLHKDRLGINISCSLYNVTQKKNHQNKIRPSSCEVIFNYGVLIFADFVVHSNHENKNQTKYNFPIDRCL